MLIFLRNYWVGKMSNFKDLSLIVPCYNQEKYLLRFFNSILRLNVKNIITEIIFVNDGSNDNTEKIIKSYLDQNNNNISYRYLKQENSGVSSARNLGLVSALGEYVWFVDPDDEIGFIDIDLVINRMREEDIEILLMGYDTVRSPSSIYSIRYNNLQYFPSKDFKYLLTSHTIESVWNKIFKKKLLIDHDINFMEKVSFAEDFFFIIKAFSESNKIFFSNINSYSYYINSNSLMGKYQNDIKNLRYKIFECYMNYCLIRKLDFTGITEIYIKDTFVSVVLNSMKKKDSKFFDIFLESRDTIKQCLNVVAEKKIKQKAYGYKDKFFKIMFNFKMYSLLIIFIMIFYSI